MSKLDKFILFTVKFVFGSLAAGFVSLYFLRIALIILGADFNSKLNVLQFILIMGIIGIPYYGSILLVKFVKKLETEEKAIEP